MELIDLQFSEKFTTLSTECINTSFIAMKCSYKVELILPLENGGRNEEVRKICCTGFRVFRHSYRESLFRISPADSLLLCFLFVCTLQACLFLTSEFRK